MVYKVRDLVVNVIRVGTPVPTPITPVAIDVSTVALTSILDATKPAFAFMPDTGVAEDSTATLISAAAIQSRGGYAGMPDPNCGGTSTETIPLTLTPSVHKAKNLLRAEDLAVLKNRLRGILEAAELSKAAATRA